VGLLLLGTLAAAVASQHIFWVMLFPSAVGICLIRRRRR